MNKRWQGFCAYFSGHEAEKTACNFLIKKGYRLLFKNFRPKRGCGANELDLIMLDKKTLVFIEVKKRSSLDNAAEVVDAKLQKRLYQGGLFFLSQNPQYQQNDCRFDVVLIDEDSNLLHLENVVEEI